MTTIEENQRLCEVESDSEMGAVFRSYWLPFALAEELPEVDCPPIRVRLLGEDLVAYRDSTGAVGLLDAHCPHRRAPLFFGRNEDCGLRCVYHGWKFDTTGACVDMPSEPEYSKFRLRISVKSYPTWEKAGMIWTYLGSELSRPAYPDYEWIRVAEAHAETHFVVSKAFEHCNYLQAVEGGIDTVHSSFLHNSDINGPPNLRSRDKHPRIEIEPTEFGYRYASLRDIGEGKIYARVNNFVLPSINGFCQTVDNEGRPTPRPSISNLFWVPVDNVTTMIFNIVYRADDGEPFAEGFHAQHERGFGISAADRIPGTYWNKRNAYNDYLIDRDLQRDKTFTGIRGIGVQDYAVQEGMGPISERHLENLASSDRAIVTARRLLAEAMDWVALGKAPKSSDPASHRLVRPADKFLAEGESWRESIESQVVATW